MARIRRLKVIGEEAYYHILSRTVGQEFLLGDVEKEKLLRIIKRYSALFFVKVTGFVIMTNHFHLIAKLEQGENYSDAEISKRMKVFYEEKDIRFIDLKRAREKLGDLSEYVKCIKQTFSYWYNRRYNRRGYFWSDRFKSVLLESGESLLNCLGYVDLNPVRAGIVERPEDYRWSSLGYRVQQGNRDGFLSFSGIFENDTPEVLSRYREFVYRTGGINDFKHGKITDRIVDREKGRIDHSLPLPKSALFRYRVRYFSDGLVIGSRAFILSVYMRFSGRVFFKKEKKIHATGISGTLFSIRRLNSITT